MGAIDKLAKLLGLSRDDAEASMHSERAARHVLNRREAIGLSAAMCAGTLFSSGGIGRAPFEGVNRLVSFDSLLRDSLLRDLYKKTTIEAAAYRTPVLFMNPRDYESLRVVIPELPPITEDPHCPPGKVFASDEETEWN